jgi:hypothetical protein
MTPALARSPKQRRTSPALAQMMPLQLQALLLLLVLLLVGRPLAATIQTAGR